MWGSPVDIYSGRGLTEQPHASLSREEVDRDVYRKRREEVEQPRFPLLYVKDAGVAMCQEDS